MTNKFISSTLILSLSIPLLFVGCGSKNDVKNPDISDKTNLQLMNKPKEIIIKQSYVNIERALKLSQALKQLQEVNGTVYILGSNALDFDIPKSSYKGIKTYSDLKKYIKDTTAKMYDMEILNDYFDEGYKLVNSFDKFEKNKKGLEHKDFDFNTQDTASLSDVFRMITEHTGFNIVVDNFIKIDENKEIDVLYKGTNIKGLLDYLSSKSNTYYDIDYEKKIINFSKYKFKLFSLTMQSQETTISQTTSLSQASLGASSGDGLTAPTDGEGDGIKVVEVEKRSHYEYLDKALASIFLTEPQLISGDGTTVTAPTTNNTEVPKETLESREYYRINPVAGTVIVFATPRKLKQAEEVLSNLEETLGKNISVSIKLFKVRLKRDNHYGVNWNYLVQKAQETTSFNSNAFSGVQNYGNLSYTNVSNGKTFSAVLSALNEYGDSTLVDTFDFLMGNNTIDYKTNSKEIQYISEVKEDTTPATATSAETKAFSVKQSNLKYGTFVLVSPRAVAGKINIKANLIFSTLEGMKKESFGDEASNLFVQQPSIEKENKKINLTMNSGEKYIVSGFIKDTVSKDYAGILPSENKIVQGLSGMNDNLSSREEYFITIESSIL